MDKILQRVIAKLKASSEVQLQGLGDFPKADPFEHGEQAGIYRGLKQALREIEEVLSSEEDEEARR